MIGSVIFSAPFAAINAKNQIPPSVKRETTTTAEFICNRSCFPKTNQYSKDTISMLYTLKHLRAIFFRLGGFSLETIKCPTQRQRDLWIFGFDTCQGA